MKQVKKIFGILVLVGLVFSCTTVDKSTKTDTEKYKIMAEELTKDCPIKKDNMQIDCFKFDETNNTFWFYMSFLDMEKNELTDEELSLINDLLKPMLLASLKNDPNFDSFKEDKINIGFIGKDKKGVELFKSIAKYDEY